MPDAAVKRSAWIDIPLLSWPCSVRAGGQSRCGLRVVHMRSPAGKLLF